MSKDWQSQAHVVILPKCRKKVLFGGLRKQIGAILRDLTSASARAVLFENAGSGMVQLPVKLKSATTHN